jgi:hypothetical protein
MTLLVSTRFHFADYFGLPEPEDAPKSLRGKARKKEQERLLSLYGGRCFECGTELTLDKNLALDRVVPRSRGGTWLTTNLQPFCEGCQIKKADPRSRQLKLLWTCCSGQRHQIAMMVRFGSALSEHQSCQRASVTFRQASAAMSLCTRVEG